MIAVKLIGGLGNQLFQYAAGLALAKHHSTELYLDIVHLNENPNGAYTKREFELDNFNFSAKIADKTILDNFNFKENRIITRLKKIFPSLFNNIIFNEHQANFHSNFFQCPSNTYLSGYWQSEKYFSTVRENILKEISINILSKNANSISERITTGNSVSIHVRRGDFVDLKRASDFHGLLQIDYYKKAIELINDKLKNPSFFIFSDDLDWCKTNLDFIPSKEFIDGKALHIAAHEELILMSCCKNNVIANSSFSWWGAWLNSNPDKMVIAPKNWFSDKAINTNDLIPSNWTKI